MSSTRNMYCFGVSAVVCLSIGLPTFLMGCNEHFYPAGCVAYRVEPTATVDALYISKSECCIQYTRVNDVQLCVNWVTCYYSSAHFDVGCTYQLDNTYSTEDSARNNLFSQFPIGSKHLVYIERAKPDKCSGNIQRVTTDLPNTGIAFLTLTGFFIIALIISCISCKVTHKPEIV